MHAWMSYVAWAVPCIVALSIVALSSYSSPDLGATEEAVLQMLKQEGGSTEWGYGAANGPATWGVAFSACKGSQQSPVEIVASDQPGFELSQGGYAVCTDNGRSPPTVHYITDPALAYKPCTPTTCRPGETCTDGRSAITMTSNVHEAPEQRLKMNWPNADGLYTEYSAQAQTIQVSVARTHARLRTHSKRKPPCVADTDVIIKLEDHLRGHDVHDGAVFIPAAL